MVEEGKTVELHYELKVNGEQVETSRGKDPLKYVHGAGQIIKGLESALEGMAVGDTKEVEVPSAKAYGPFEPRAVIEVPREKFTDAKDIQVGMEVASQADNGQVTRGIVSELKLESVVVDFNHPLAGKDLVFNVEVTAVS